MVQQCMTLIISDRLCFISFTNLFISAMGILVKSYIGEKSYRCTSQLLAT